jgi:hypothetical protein
MSSTAPVTDNDVLLTAVKAATFAPSVHNSQPWRFELHGDSLDIFADTERWLRAIDPIGRELSISCGAAIYFARLALRGLSRQITTALLPTPSRPEHLARITMTGRDEPSDDERSLIRSIPIRYTDRGVYDNRPVPDDLIETLRRGVAAEGAWLRPVDGSKDSVEVAILLAHADDVQQADPSYREELARWSRYDDDALDGISRKAVPTTAVADRASNYRLRDFDVDRRATPVPKTGTPPLAETPFVCLIGTAGDDKRSWLEAGQALGWLLLRAAADGVSASPMTQVLEVPSTRAELTQRLRLLSHPQTLLRMGYGTGRPTTHRRPVDDVVRSSERG